MSGSPDLDLAARASRIRLLLLDVDGVLTDASVAVSATAGKEAKTFSIRDGAGIVWARREGLEIGVLSGRASGATRRRAAELGIELVIEEGPDKKAAFDRLLASSGRPLDEIAYMGDDLPDLPILVRVGLAAAPADAVTEVARRVHWRSSHAGGRGAVREFIELILQARGQWASVVGRFEE
jgi:3-deoxy-D-manno-octulosonate 8-phosphate phosphatase (KDO 8-P phosphatase)